MVENEYKILGVQYQFAITKYDKQKKRLDVRNKYKIVVIVPVRKGTVLTSLGIPSRTTRKQMKTRNISMKRLSGKKNGCSTCAPGEALPAVKCTKPAPRKGSDLIRRDYIIALKRPAREEACETRMHKRCRPILIVLDEAWRSGNSGPAYRL